MHHLLSVQKMKCPRAASGEVLLYQFLILMIEELSCQQSKKLKGKSKNYLEGLLY